MTRIEHSGADHKTPRVYTPETLARRWSCSAKHIRNLVRGEKLEAFRLGGKLIRITAEEVDRFERDNATVAEPGRPVR